MGEESPLWRIPWFPLGTRLSSVRISKGRNHDIPLLASIAESRHLHYTTSNSSLFFSHYLKSMRKEDMKFDLLAIISLPKKLNGSALELGAHRSPQNLIQQSGTF
eukprot:TRINITY_DN15976_c2_g1_i1.p1 TRINITY_DN15976_c2_g1~~TRINITY_DN15976_c2_g1_i1.p1  ORF type:complete len:105 (-),score=13.09 TRINITY_DN15976_c2_g1_i1:79-393(-)